MSNKEKSLFTATEGETFATKSPWRKKKAEEQPRDANGRWIADGARITFKDELAGKRVAATVVSTSNGDAIVERDNPDGSVSRQTVANNTVEVISSKARIPKEGTSFQSKTDDFNPVLESKAFKDGLASKNQAVIVRPDGYQLEASSPSGDADPSEAMINKKNPIVYQLFAPDGRSLGTYGSKASKTFNDMVDGDKAEGDKAVPVSKDTPQETLFSNSSIVRVSRDRKQAILKDSNGEYRPVDLKTLSAGAAAPFTALVSGGQWRRALPDEFSGAEQLMRLSADSITASAPRKATPYRVPLQVKREIVTALESIDPSRLLEQDRQAAQALANSESVSIDEIKWIDSFLSNQETSKKIAGGEKGEQWASKILSGFADNTKHDFGDSKFSYFATGDGSNGWNVSDILAVNFSTDEVYSWTEEGFNLVELSIEDIEEPVILPIDEYSAEALTGWIDSGREGQTFNLADINPAERNLVELALSELNLDELEEIGAIVAAGGAVVDVDGYTPAERSVNAKNQPRAGGGKFGSKRSDSPVPEAEEEKEIKARLEQELPLIDPAARMTEWLATAPVTAAGAPMEAPTAAPEAETAPAAEPAPEAEQEPVQEESADTGESKSLYFAIVDEVDKTAVLDVVAITKNDLGEAEAWKRSGNDWVPAPEYMAKFNGTTPPPVVELEVPEPAKAVLGQVDSYDAERGNSSEEPAAAAEAEVAPVAEQAPVESTPVVASSGFTLNNGQWGIFNVTDLTNAVTMFDLVNEDTKTALKQHIRKRAFAMNRMDLVPADWREATLAERGESFLNTSPLYGEHGEVIVAAGVPGVADTASDWAAAMRLQNYWTRGKGALKIRWGTPGDLTRAHKHLAKYVGPNRAWGLAQKFHKSIFGVYNHTHDVATGQYKPRRGKRH